MSVLSTPPRVAVKNIVVAVDFTPASDVALQYAIAIGRNFGSKLHLVHAVQPPSHAPGAGTLWGSETVAEAEERLGTEARKCGELERSCWVLKGSELDIVERILSFDDVDLVVIGSHRARGFRRLASGSAAEHFFRHVRCPIMAVGPCAATCKPMWKPKRLLLATDLQSEEAAATRCAVFLAREHDARLALLHVAPPAPPPFPDDEQVIARPYFESRLRQLLAYKPGLSYPAEVWVEFGEDAVAEIVRVARERSMDLIVISVHREEPWGFHFVHEAYRIVAEAPCPVLITQRRF